jgi:hypothetical protein
MLFVADKVLLSRLGMEQVVLDERLNASDTSHDSSVYVSFV